ncbi:MAG TPA: sterol desaturase family protein [Gemmatimonadales bacterium]|jgi:sterol desaturase/sphingolipid hydroxylase (fatty acid hydroxylase superfamily)
MVRQYVSNKDVSVRIFRSDLLEFFSHVHWTVPHLIYVPVIVVMAALAARALSWGPVAAYAALGALIWTPFEYFAHRFIFHAGPTIESEVRDIVAGLTPGEPALRHMRTLRQRHYFIAHGVHHDFPNDTKRLVMPPSVSIPLAVVFFLVFRWLAGPAAGPALFAGFVAGYLAYDTIHYAVHHFSLHNPVLLSLKKHHYRHHYNDSTRDFGVSSIVWDLVMGTYSGRTK